MADFQDPAYHERTIEDIMESSDIDDEETIKALAGSSYEFFLEHVLGLNTNSPLIQEAIDVIQNPPEQPENKATKIAIMAPRGHSKTYTYTVGQTLWRAYSESGKQILLASASRSQSKDILETVKRIIERNDLLQHLKPSVEMREKLGDTMDLKSDEGAWAAKSIITTTDVTIKTKTFGSSIRSKHVDYVFLDDVLQDQSAGSRDVETEKDIFYNVISPVVENRGGTLQIVGTPMSHNDLLMELMEKDNFYRSRYQAYDPETEEPLWPWNWNIEQLKKKKAEIGPARFAREYMCDPMSIEERFFPWDTCVEPNLEESFGEGHWKLSGDGDYDDWSFYLGVDIALSDADDADFTVFTVIGQHPEGQNFLVDLHREKGMDPETIADTIENLDERYAFNEGRVERNAIGEGVWDTISKRAKLSGRIEAFETTRKTRPQILSSLQAGLYRNDLVLHKHEVLIDEILAFHKNRSGKLEGKRHDDTVMSLAICYSLVNDPSHADVSLSVVGNDGETVATEEGIKWQPYEDGEDDEMDIAII